MTENYIGRFAPSPTGKLHLGSLCTAWASYLHAKQHQGKWLVRMEDIDPPREEVGAAEHILATLKDFDLYSDKEILFQHQRYAAYQQALELLKTKGLVYPCYCSRNDIIKMQAKTGVDGLVYPGHCRDLPIDRTPPNNKTAAWRIKVTDKLITFNDGCVGDYSQNLACDVGDFILLRADGYWAYQLAVVVDDAFQQITHIVRGQDLLVSTPRQIYLQQLLGFHTPEYIHLPLILNEQGQKLSKQNKARVVTVEDKASVMPQINQYLANLNLNLV